MPIITKPSSIMKGESFTFSLSKSELADLQILNSDSYFRNSDNWDKVVLNYNSSVGNQHKSLTFNASDISPSFVFSTSDKARNSFIVYSIDIIDFDGQIFSIPRSELNAEDFDIDLSGSVTESFLLLDDGDSFMLDSDEILSL